MNRSIIFRSYCFWGLFFLNTVHAASIVDVTPSSASPIVIAPNGATYVTFSARNTTSKTLSGLSIDPGYGMPVNAMRLSLISNNCAILSAGASCSFVVSLQGTNRTSEFTLMPRICAYNGALCSVPVLSNRINIRATSALPSSRFPLPYAGTFYPIYNSGAGQWLPPNQAPVPPFNRVSAIFVAFAHTYPQQNGAIFTYERGQPDQAARLALLVQSARAANPHIKILISLGWNKNDWTYVNHDYLNHANIFVPSVIQFIRSNHLDGLDIDDESIGGSSGSIPQANFDGVIANLRNALNYAALQDGKPYYLTLTPAGNNNQPGGVEDTQLDAVNFKSFDLINIQSYFSEEWGTLFFNRLIGMGYPKSQMANGIDTQETNCSPEYPPYIGLAGIFNWNMTKDSTCSNYVNTVTIANMVGYYGAFK